MSFETLGLEESLLAQVERQGFSTPTPIQAAAIPVALTGRDVIGLAQTGTGKTAAFVLPIIQQLANVKGRGIKALIVTPTRELAEQVHDVVKTFIKGTHLKSATVYGGVNMLPQEQNLRAGVDIVVACPGRLLDHMSRGYVRLNNLQTLVLDEADRMFDMGFLPDIKRILAQLPAQRQTLLFSATMAPEIKELAMSATRNPETVQVDIVAPATTVAHAIYPVSEHSKTALLLELLHRTSTDSVLVFTRTKHRANRVTIQLEREGYKVARLHSNRSQNQRQLALDGFRNGTYQVLVATDIAARGIDVATVSHVVNYDIPDTPDAYIHRIGRTGRAARTGDAFTLVTPEDGPMVRTIERVIGHGLERRAVSGFVEAPPPLTRHGNQPAGFGEHRQPSGGRQSSRSQQSNDQRSQQTERRAGEQPNRRRDSSQQRAEGQQPNRAQASEPRRNGQSARPNGQVEQRSEQRGFRGERGSRSESGFRGEKGSRSESGFRGEKGFRGERNQHSPVSERRVAEPVGAPRERRKGVA